jgi:hypothetical protein
MPCLLIRSYPKFLRNLLPWTRKMERKVLSSDTVSYPAIWMCVLQLCSTSLTSEDKHLHAVFDPFSDLFANQQNHVTAYSSYACFFLSPVHSLCSFFLYLSAVRSFQSQPFQGEQSGHMCLPCEAQTVWCLCATNYPFALRPPLQYQVPYVNVTIVIGERCEWIAEGDSLITSE